MWEISTNTLMSVTTPVCVTTISLSAPDDAHPLSGMARFGLSSLHCVSWYSHSDVLRVHATVQLTLPFPVTVLPAGAVAPVAHVLPPGSEPSQLSLDCAMPSPQEPVTAVQSDAQ